MTRKTTRRRFIGQSAAIGAGFWIGSQTVAKAQVSALQSLSAACVGVGGKGGSDTSHIGEQGVKIVGLCDVDGGTLTKKGREFPDAKQFSDYREMLDQLGDKVDIVTVSTPDHNHAAAAVKAMRMKKHVYCQKPLTWSIQEARTMREVSQEMGVVTQMGNQGTSEDGLREAVEVIRSGAIGDVSAPASARKVKRPRPGRASGPGGVVGGSGRFILERSSASVRSFIRNARGRSAPARGYRNVKKPSMRMSNAQTSFRT